MKPFKFSQSVFFKTASLLFLIIAFGYCFSFGYGYLKLDPGMRVARVAQIFMDFLLFYFFLWLGRKAKEQEFDMPSDDEAKKIIDDFNSSESKKKPSSVTKKGIHKSVHK